MLTAHACRALAADDRFRAATAILSTRRACFEASVEAWSRRADFLEHVVRLNEARRASGPPADLTGIAQLARTRTTN